MMYIADVKNLGRVVVVLVTCTLSVISHAQPGDRVQNPKARILDAVFPTSAPQKPYLFKLVLRFNDTDSQMMVVVYPDKEKYWVRRCEVTTFSLDDESKRWLSESLSKLSPETSDDTLRTIAAGAVVATNHYLVPPQALDKPLNELRSILISPALPSRVSVDAFSEYEFWYDNWQESVHYTLTGPPSKDKQDDLIRWMTRFKASLPALLSKASGSTL